MIMRIFCSLFPSHIFHLLTSVCFHYSPFKDTSGPSLNILIKLMSMVSLTAAPIIRGWQDWQFWYWGLLPIGLCAIATILVHHFYWKNTQDIAAPIDDVVKDAPLAKDVETPAAEDQAS